MIPQWKRFGANRYRAGVCVPLFSIYSEKSIGVGEFPDLKLLVDWCKKTGQSIIQLLPLNDTGFNFRPYDAESSFALDAMYLALEELRFVDLTAFKTEIQDLRKQFPIESKVTRDAKRFDIGIKRAKLVLLRKMFQARGKAGEQSFTKYKEGNTFWLAPYAEYKVLKEQNQDRSWETWGVGSPIQQDAEFHTWLQWQAFLQMVDAKKYANKKGVFIMGDLPFLVSRDSADVRSSQDCFKLDKASGAPPDLYLADGQMWGMPPYNWDKVEARGYEYLIQKLKYAENFYDLFRIDHFVGLFRIWVFPEKAFDPPEEALWDAHGRKILNVILQNTRMLPCAEDLGCIPECSFKLLEETGIPGVDVQRWMRDWKNTQDFLVPSAYRKNAMAVISTHDMTPLKTWWETETKKEDREKFWNMLNDGIRRGTARRAPTKATPAFIKACLQKANESNALFSIQLWQDWLSLGSYFESLAPNHRLNVPGSMNELNWRLQIPCSLEKMNTLSLNRVIRSLNKKRS